jgi:hypothetical protein
VEVTLVDHAALPGVGRLAVSVFDSGGKEVTVEEVAPPPGRGIKPMGSFVIETGKTAGQYRVSARLFENGEVRAESVESFLALPRVDLADLPRGLGWVGRVPAWLEEVRAVPGPDPSGQADLPQVIVAAIPGSLRHEEWEILLQAVEAGRLAVIGPLLPRDELALHALADRGIPVGLHLGIGNWMGCYHWVPDSDLFAGLPAGGLAGETYAEVLPRYVMSELGRKVFAGSLRNTQTRREPPTMLWYSDIESAPLGNGELLLCQYRAFEQADTNPLAGRLLLNLLRLAGQLA